MPNAKAPQGFAAMDPEIVREISSLGGQAAQSQRNARRWTKAEARAAGRKGGLTAGANKRAAKLREIAIAAGNIGRAE